MKTIEQLDLKGQRALILLDFNVPLDDGVAGAVLYSTSWERGNRG